MNQVNLVLMAVLEQRNNLNRREETWTMLRSAMRLLPQIPHPVERAWVLEAVTDTLWTMKAPDGLAIRRDALPEIIDR